MNKSITTLMSSLSQDIKKPKVKLPKAIDVVTTKGDIVFIHLADTWELTDAIGERLSKSITLHLPIAQSTSMITIHGWLALELYYILGILKKDGILINTTTKVMNGLKNNTWLRETFTTRKGKYLKKSNVAKFHNWVMKDHQDEFFDWYNDVVPKYGLRGALIAFTMGGGKALSLDSKLLYATGWRPIANVQVGDKIIGSYGEFVKVLGVYPQPSSILRTIHFNDGTTVRCSSDHIWSVMDGDKLVNKTTAVLQADLLQGVSNELPNMLPHVEDSRMELPIPSNILIEMLMLDMEMPKQITDILYGLGLTEILSGVKFIPVYYTYHSQITRTEIFNALTGHLFVTEDGFPIGLKFKSITMAKSFMELARMSGFVCGMVENSEVDEYAYDNSGVEIEYEIKFYKRKEVIKIVDDTEPEESICIAVESSDKLFLTDGFTLTHNTFMSVVIGSARDIERIIVICPKPAIPSPWIEAFDDFYKVPQQSWTPTTKRQPNDDDFAIVVNYAFLEKLPALLDKLKTKRTIVVLDESHNLNTKTAKVTKLFLEFIKRPEIEDILFLSGTPVKAEQKELITLFKAIDPTFTEDVEKKFLKLYTYLGSMGYKILARRLGLSSFIVERSTLNLVGSTSVNVDIRVKNGDRFEMSNIQEHMQKYSKDRIKILTKRRPAALKTFFKLIKKAKKAHTREHGLYMRAVKTIIGSTSYNFVREEMVICNRYEKEELFPEMRRNGTINEFRAVRSIAKYPPLKVLGEALGRVLGRYRIEAAMAVAAKADIKGLVESSIKKTLFFTNSTEVVELLVKRARPHKAVPVYGHHTKHMQTLVDKINTNHTANPICATFASLSTAVPLPIVSHVVIVDSPFRSYILGQALARAHRLGQDTHVTFTYLTLVTKGLNVLERSLDLAKWSAETSSMMLGIESPIEFPEGVVEEIKDKEVMSKEDYETYHSKPSGSIFVI